MPLSDILNVSANEMLYSVIFPFILIFTLMFGALEFWGIFSRRVRMILALIFTLFTTQTPVFAWFATLLPTYGAIAAVGIFGALFFFGVIIWALGKGRDIYYEYESPTKAVEKINKEIGKLYDKLDRARNEAEEAEIMKDIEDLERKKKIILGKARHRY